MSERQPTTPVNFIVHSLREVNMRLEQGGYFFVDLRRDDIVLYEVDEKPLSNPVLLRPADAYSFATEYYEDRIPNARIFAKTANFLLNEGA
ncbi:hypothetical protein [Rhizobium sp. P38BS-XIX]|uniref:hypothetical protein n=1 Tax=Rhizobium sp. P38BS-XIX TaxID=2726740 RepID=UPI0032B118B0